MSTILKVAQLIGITGSLLLAGCCINVSTQTLPALLSALPNSVTNNDTKEEEQDNCLLTSPLTATPRLILTWSKLYAIGHIQGPALAIPPTLAWLYAAYAKYRTANESPYNAFLVAAVLTIGIVPYTLATMVSTNERLFALTAQVRQAVISASGNDEVGILTGSEDAEVKALVMKWQRLNLVRGCLPLMGAIMGIWAAIA